MSLIHFSNPRKAHGHRWERRDPFCSFALPNRQNPTVETDHGDPFFSGGWFDWFLVLRGCFDPFMLKLFEPEQHRADVAFDNLVVGEQFAGSRLDKRVA